MINRIKTDPQTRLMINIVCGLVAFFIGFHFAFRFDVPDFGLYWAGAKVLPYANYIDLDKVIRVQNDFSLYVWPHPAPPYGAPPLIALVFVPLSRLSFDNARILFAVFELTLISVTVYRVAPRWWGLIALLVVPSVPIFVSLKFGNWAIVTGALILLAYKDAEDDHITRSIIWIAIAVAFKPYPFLLFVPFLFMFRYKDLIYAAVIGLAFYSASALVLGWDKFMNAMNYMFKMARETADTDSNMGLPGVVRRFSSPAPAKLIAIVALIAAVGLLWRYRQRNLHTQLALAALLALLTGTVVWPMYFVATFPALLWFRTRPGCVRAVAYVAGALIFLPPGRIVILAHSNLDGPIDLVWPNFISGLVILGCFIFQLEKEKDLDYRHTLQPSSTASK